MVFIPIELVILFGSLAVMREIREVFLKHNYKNFGELFAYLWTFVVYLILYNPPDGFPNGINGQAFVRVGIFLIFLDKSIIFIFETYPLLLKKIKKVFKIKEG